MPKSPYDKKSLEEDMNSIDVSDEDISAASVGLPGSDVNYKPDLQPTSYLDLLRHSRKNYKPEGFDFDVSMFENLCSVWVPKNNFPLLLHCSASALDAFCRKVYNMDFPSAYDILTGVADAFARRSINNLALKGNNTALACVIKHFMKLESEAAPQPSVTIINDLGPSSKQGSAPVCDDLTQKP